MANKSVNWKNHKVWIAALVGVVVLVAGVSALGRIRVNGRVHSIREGKGAAARFFVSAMAPEWASRLGLPLEDRNAMTAALGSAGSSGVWLVTREIPLDTTLMKGESVTGWGSEPVLYVMRFTGEPVEVQQARALEGAGRNAEAKALLDAYLNRLGGPDSAHGIAFYAGVLASKAGDLAMMERIYDAIGMQHLDNLQYLYNWGLAKLYLKKPGEAVSLLERAGKLAPQDLGIQQLLADAYQAAGRKSDAKALMEKMAKLYPQDANVAARLKAYAN